MNSFTDRSTLLEHRRSRLEALVGRSNYITAYHPSQLSRLFSHMFSGIVDWLTKGSMPHISKTMQGDTEVWKVYDPVSNRTLYFEQENALRVWMEERYYQ